MALAMLALGLWLSLPGCGPQQLPTRLSSQQFGQMIEDFSEEGDKFESDNLVSNETGYLRILKDLAKCPPDQVYLGVGPDQNFSYIAATRPRLAFIVDIRRANLVEHLLFKALFELAPTPQEYLQKLLSRERALTGATLGEWLKELDQARPDEEAYQANLVDIKARVTQSGVHLRPQDLADLERIYRAFFERGLDLRYDLKYSAPDEPTYPTFRQFLLSKDASGKQAGYLSDTQSYDFLRAMQQQNRIVPLVGDFAGHHALAELARYLHQQGGKVSLFYASNVEYYLLPDQELDDQYEAFLNNLKFLPTSPDTMLVRTWNNKHIVHPRAADEQFTSVAVPLWSFLQRVESNRYGTYKDILFDE